MVEDKKLTDSEIVKDFTEKTELIGSMSSVYLDEDEGLELYEAMRNVLILINRQKADIKRLNNELDIMSDEHLDILERNLDILERLQTAKTESYKECIKKIQQIDVSMSDGYIVIPKNKFDNLLNELVDGKNG